MLMNRSTLSLVSFLILLSLAGYAQEIKSPVAKATNHEIKIIFAGDMMGHMPQINAAYVDSSKGYNYLPVFEYILPEIQSANLAIANLEVPLAGKPYSGYPQFSSPDELAYNLKQAGFDLLITANNHAVDRGSKGLIRTLNVLDSAGLMHTGTFRDPADKAKRNPFMLTIDGFHLAILNYTYGTNGLKADKPVLVNYIDTAAIRRDIHKSYELGAGFVIVTLHWGIEYQREQNPEQTKLAKFIAKCGAGAIIGSHPHVVEPFAILTASKSDTARAIPVIYSMGNFVSNQRDRYRDGGILYELTLHKKDSTIVSTEKFMPIWVYKGWSNGKMIYRLIPPEKFTQARDSLKFGSADSTKCMEFYHDTRDLLSNLGELGTDAGSSPVQAASNQTQPSHESFTQSRLTSTKGQ